MYRAPRIHTVPHMRSTCEIQSFRWNCRYDGTGLDGRSHACPRSKETKLAQKSRLRKLEHAKTLLTEELTGCQCDRVLLSSSLRILTGLSAPRGAALGGSHKRENCIKMAQEGEAFMIRAARVAALDHVNKLCFHFSIDLNTDGASGRIMSGWNWQLLRGLPNPIGTAIVHSRVTKHMKRKMSCYARYYLGFEGRR
jgi:hypothetical protein